MNVVFILSDRHTASFTGCYGSPIARTPHLDRLAREGTRFDAAWCLSPTCAPTRASMFTGRFIHEIGTWCNSHPWTGRPRGWPHALRDAGVPYTTIGKLDFAPGVDHGIAGERLPIHRQSRDVTTLYRDQDLPRYPMVRGFCRTGPAKDLSAYRRDAAVADEAATWLRESRPDGPWVLSVNFSHLHRPWLPTADLWDYYDARVRLEDLDARYAETHADLHPCARSFSIYTGGHLVTREQIRRGLVGYYGAVEILDRFVGTVLCALEDLHLLDDTLVLYASDHGGNCGEHVAIDHGGLYEESVRVPLVVRGPGVARGRAVPDPVSLLDIFPTLTAALRDGSPSADVSPPDGAHGESLWPALSGGTLPERREPVLCQFHATGFPAGGFAIREGRWKYIEWPGFRPSLYDLEDDPLELHDLSGRNPEGVRPVLDRMAARLRTVCYPADADARAHADQAALRRRMVEDGSILHELDRRGYEAVTGCLVPKPDLVLPGP